MLVKGELSKEFIKVENQYSTSKDSNIWVWGEVEESSSLENFLVASEGTIEMHSN